MRAMLLVRLTYIERILLIAVAFLAILTLTSQMAERRPTENIYKILSYRRETALQGAL